MEGNMNHITPTDWKFDIGRLHDEVIDLMQYINFDINNSPNQICLTSRPDARTPLYDGAGSLYDFEKKRFFATESEFIILNREFEGTYLEEIYNTINTVDKLGRARLLTLQPRNCYSFHRDTEIRYHMAIKTNKSCFIMYEDVPPYHIPADGVVYRVDALYHHTALNAHKIEDRIHLVFNSTTRIKRT